MNRCLAAAMLLCLSLGLSARTTASAAGPAAGNPGRAPVPGQLTFFVYGDTSSVPANHTQVASAIMAEAGRLKQFTFVLHVGDFVTSGGDEADYRREFFEPAARLAGVRR